MAAVAISSAAPTTRSRSRNPAADFSSVLIPITTTRSCPRFTRPFHGPGSAEPADHAGIRRGSEQRRLDMTDVPPLRDRKAFQALELHYADIGHRHLRAMFQEDPGRGERLTAEAEGLYLDYSKNRVTDETMRLLVDLAEESGLPERREAMFRGEHINVSEDRAVPRWWRTGWTSCPKCTKSWTGWRSSPSGCAPASGRGTPASPSATWSTSASAAPTSARSWPTRRSST